VDRFRHLHGQLAGGHEDEADRVGLAGLLGQPLEERQGERGRLPGAGGGLAEEVPALEQWGDRLALDRRGLLVTERAQRGQQLRAEAQVGKSDVVVGRDVGPLPRWLPRVHARRVWTTEQQ
jgi:hypothetical protein